MPLYATWAATPIAFDVPRQTLRGAVAALAHQAHVVVTVQSSIAQVVTTQALRGTMDAQSALTKLLAGTGLGVTRQAGGQFSVVSGNSLRDAAATESRSEEMISVAGRKNSGGGGMMVKQFTPKTRSEVTQEFVSKQSPTLTPAALIASLPGVQSDNQGGLSVGNDTMHIRGLDQSEIGFVFEGVPYSNPFTYDPNTASVIDNENIRSVSVLQGSVDLTAPLWNADGAEVSTEEMRPHDKMGGFVDGAGGTHSLQKEFIRLDTGYIGNTGVKAFASYSFSSANLWRGPGFAHRWHVDSGASKSWGKNSHTDFIFSWNQQAQTNFETPSLAQWHLYGDSYNYSGSYTPGSTNYYAYNMKPTTTYLITLRNHFDLGNGLALDAQPYFLSAPGAPESMSNIAYSNGYFGADKYTNLDGYAAKSGTLPTVSIHPNSQQSSGLNLIGSWKKGANTLSLSYWYSYVTHTEFDEYYAIDAKGNWTQKEPVLTVNGGRTLSSFDINGYQQINALGLDDRISFLGGRLSIDAGVKFSMLTRQFSENLPAAVGSPSRSTGNLFVPTPQILISYQLTNVDQIYVNGTSGYHAPKAYSAQVPAYSMSTGRPSTYEMPKFDPEFMIGEEIGYRHNGEIILNIAGFNYNMTHHQISSQSYAAGSSYLISQTIDAGGETARGVQLELGTHPWHHLSAYGSAQYMHTSIDNNVASSGDYLPTKGKEEVGSPKLVAALGLTYDDGRNFANFNFRYTGSQYSTLMNDQGIPSYFTADMSIGRNLPPIGHHVYPKIQLNLINLGDVHYLSSVTGFGLTAQNRTGIFGSAISSSTPSYTVGSGFTAIGSIAASFD